MDTILDINERADAEEIKKLLQALTPDEERAALTFIQGVRLGQSTAAAPTTPTGKAG